MQNHASGTSEILFVLCIALTPQSGDSSGAILEVPFKALLHLPQREERADIGKDDVVEARKWIPNTPYIINTRARRCACIFIRLAAIKASNCIIVSLDSRRRFILVDLSAKVRTPPL